MNIHLSERDLDIVIYVARHREVRLRDLEKYIMDKYELSLKRAGAIIRRLVNDNILAKKRDSSQRLWVYVAPAFISTVAELYSSLYMSDRDRLRYYEKKTRETRKPKKKRKTTEIVEEAIWEKGWEP